MAYGRTEGTSALSENDPYRNMERSDIKPKNDIADRKNQGKIINFDEAKKDLRGGEDAAADNDGSQQEQAPDNLTSIRKNEDNPEKSGFYRGKVEGKLDKKGKKKGGKKKKGPLALASLAIGLFGFFGLGAQSSMMFSLAAQIEDTFNSMKVSASVRSNRFLRFQMDTTRYKDPIKTRLFRSDTFKITSRQKTRLATQGIFYDDTTFVNPATGKGIAVLKFDDGTGKLKIITADEKTAGTVKNLIASGSVKYDDLEMEFDPEPTDFRTHYAVNEDFQYGFNKGSKTWKGAISGWFESMTVKFLESNKLTRNRFKNFREKVHKAEAGNSRTVAQDLMSKDAETLKVEDASSAKYDPDSSGEYVQLKDENGNPTGEYMKKSDADSKGLAYDETQLYTMNTESGTSGTIDLHSGIAEADTPEAKAKAKAEAKIKATAEAQAQLEKLGERYKGANKASSAFSFGTNIACGLWGFAQSVSLLATAAEMIQILTLTTSYLESIQKVEAGDGDDSPMHTLADALTTPMTGSHVVLNDDASGSVTKTTAAKSAMQSSGVGSLFSGAKVDPYDESVNSFDMSNKLDRVINKAMGGVSASTKVYAGCAALKIAAAGAGAVLDAVEIASCIAGVVGAGFTFGVSLSSCAPLLGEKIATTVVAGVGIAGAVTLVISVITPHLTEAFTRDLISDLGGEDLGNAITSGSNGYLGSTHRANGGSLMDKDSYISFRVAQEQVLAEESEYERRTKSPFDISSPDTFLGTIFSKLMTHFSSSSTATSVVSSVGSLTKESLISLLPTASAYDISESLYSDDVYQEKCPYLYDIGAVGDAFCNPYIGTDMSSMDDDPADIINTVDDLGGFQDSDSESDNVKIKGDSDLAKYILYCANRTSTFGIADQNIINEVSNWADVRSSSSAVNTVSNATIGAVPIFGDVVDIVQNSQAVSNYGYITGQVCVTGSTDNGSSVGDWDNEQKYYQRFIEDQTLAEATGLIEKSAVTAFLDEYYEQNPLDNSYEGILARYSGLEKEEVIAVLDLMDYASYIADYDPTERYQFMDEFKIEEDQNIYIEPTGNQIADLPRILKMNEISYFDIRNRDAAIA